MSPRALPSVLVDTSVWIAFFQRSAEAAPLVPLLERDRVFVHEWSMRELFLGSGLPKKYEGMLTNATRVGTQTDDFVWRYVNESHLRGGGIGWVDAHLLTSAAVAGISCWSLDVGLALAARRLVVHPPATTRILDGLARARPPPMFTGA